MKNMISFVRAQFLNVLKNWFLEVNKTHLKEEIWIIWTRTVNFIEKIPTRIGNKMG